LGAVAPNQDIGRINLPNLTILPAVTASRASGTGKHDTDYGQAGGFKDLSGLKILKVLSLVDSVIDDDVLAEVAQFSNLEKLNLSGSWISGKGLSQLVRLTHLKGLDLSSCRRIDDTAIE